MKLTKEQLRKIIKEETNKFLNETEQSPDNIAQGAYSEMLDTINKALTPEQKKQVISDLRAGDHPNESNLLLANILEFLMTDEFWAGIPKPDPNIGHYG